MDRGKKFLSDLKLYSDYLKWNEKKGRYETWDEACEDVLKTHLDKYGEKVQPLIDEVLPYYQNMDFLASQRNLQYRSKQIQAHNARLFNCVSCYGCTPDIISKSFYLLLCGCGVGYSLKQKYIEQLPLLHKRKDKAIIFEVPDSIEGWALSSEALVASYCKHPSLPPQFFGKQIKFDYSKIRSKGSFISGGFRAPGPEGLKLGHERIERTIEQYLDGKDKKDFTSIIMYDVLMHDADATLSGGVRRSATDVIFDIEDKDMMHAKTGNWRQTHPWRARSNNSVALIKGEFTEKQFKELLKKNNGDNDVGFVFSNHEDENYNPCFEVGFNFYNKIKNKNIAAFQACNLVEINASNMSYKSGNFNEKKFFEVCRAATIVGTLQAGFTNYPFLGEQTEEIVSGEALLGVGITGWMARPELFSKDLLQKGAQIVLDTNEEVAKLININLAARTTLSKPSGNASVVLMTESGVSACHSRRGFRIMQLNKDSETARWLEANAEFLLEESVWSSTNSDYVVFTPYENPEYVICKDKMKGVKHLELIKLAQEFWVNSGKRTELCYNPSVSHNISNTVIIDDMDDISKYVFKHQNNFAAVSFLSDYGDKDYNQAPFTSVLNTQEIVEKYGDGAMFMSGLIVDGLHYFNNNLWEAADHIMDSDLKLSGTRPEVLLKKDWLRRAKKFASNYFKGDTKQLVYCMKDLHLWHKFNNINRRFKKVDFNEVLSAPQYKNVDEIGAMACSGGSCEVSRI